MAKFPVDVNGRFQKFRLWIRDICLWTRGFWLELQGKKRGFPELGVIQVVLLCIIKSQLAHVESQSFLAS